MKHFYFLLFVLLLLLKMPVVQASAPPDPGPGGDSAPPIRLVIEPESLHFVIGVEPTLPSLISQQYIDENGENQTALIQLDWIDAALDNTKQDYFTIIAQTSCDDPAVSIPEMISTTCYFWDPAQPHLATCQLLPDSNEIMFFHAAERPKGEVTVWWSQDDGETWGKWPRDSIQSTATGISLPYAPIPDELPCIFLYEEQMPDGTLAHSNFLLVRLYEDGSLYTMPKDGSWNDGDHDGGDRDPNPPLTPEPEPNPEPAPPPYVPPSAVEPPAAVTPDTTPSGTPDVAQLDKWKLYVALFTSTRKLPVAIPPATQPPESYTPACPEESPEESAAEPGPPMVPSADPVIGSVPSEASAPPLFSAPVPEPTEVAVVPAEPTFSPSPGAEPLPDAPHHTQPDAPDKLTNAPRGVPAGPLLFLVVAVSLSATLPVLLHRKGGRRT